LIILADFQEDAASSAFDMPEFPDLEEEDNG